MNENSKKLTKNQKIVLEFIQKSNRPVKAYSIVNNVNKRGIKAPPQVYRALEKLIKIGEIHKFESQNAFVACNSKCVEPHGTIFSICKSCDQIDEISDKKLYKYLSEVRDMNGLKLSGYNLELFGTCKTCDQKHLQNMNQ